MFEIKTTVPVEEAFFIAVFVVLTTWSALEYVKKFAAVKKEPNVFASGD